MAVLSAERIKITTTKSPLWCTIIIIVLGLGLATVFGLSAKSSLSNPNGAMMPTVSGALSGVTGFGVLVLMIMAALAITSEYRFGTIRTTFQAVPNRASVLIAKAGLIGGFGAVLTLVLSFGAFGLTKATSGDAGRFPDSVRRRELAGRLRNTDLRVLLRSSSSRSGRVAPAVCRCDRASAVVALADRESFQPVRKYRREDHAVPAVHERQQFSRFRR